MKEPDNLDLQNEVSTKRLETLTDGIFTIAMTLLAFGLPFPNTDDFMSWLIKSWPSFLSFLLSFVIAGVFWVATHTDFQYIRRADHVLIWLNIFFLLFISLIPFSAGMLGKYHNKEFAIIIYGGNMLFCVLFRYGIWYHATRNHLLVDADLDPRLIHFGMRSSLFPMITYSIAIILALVSICINNEVWITASTWVSMALYAITPIPYILGLFYHHVYQTTKQ